MTADIFDLVARGLGYCFMFAVAVGLLAVVANAAVERVLRWLARRRPKPAQAAVQPDLITWTGPPLISTSEPGILMENDVTVYDMAQWRKKGA